VPSSLKWSQIQTRPILMIPGPTELPWPVIQALNQPPAIQYDRGFDETVLEPNMTLHFMPGIWLDDWGIAISEAIRITDTGVETFCNFPRQLFVK